MHTSSLLTGAERAVWRCVGDGGSFRWTGGQSTEIQRSEIRELVSVSGSNHMGGSDDERVWEKKLMDHRQRKVKGVEVYI
jgi:hypothetical protein